jgi:hypothetical protein
MSLKTTSQRKLTNSRLNSSNLGIYVTSGLLMNLDAGIVASYPGSGTAWYDLSGNNKNGTLVNGPIFSYPNYSIQFDGVDDSVSISSLVTSDGNNVTIEIWFKILAFGDISLFYNGNGGSNGYGFQFGACGSTASTLFIYFGGLYCNVVSYGGMSTDTWYQAVFTRTTTPSTSNIMYINGISRSTNTSYNPNAPSGNTSVASGAFRGYVSSVRVYNRALSANEVLQNYNAIKGRFGL